MQAYFGVQQQQGFRPCSRPSLRLLPARQRILSRAAASTQADEAAADKALEAVALEAGLADLARQALSADPEAAAQLKRYEAAVVRLEKAKAAEKELEAIMKDAMKAAAEQDASAAATARNRADQLLAEAEVAAAERLLQAAEIEYSSAVQEQLRLSRAVGQDGDRVESGKAAALAAAGGLAGSLPFLLSASTPGLQGILSLGASLAACLLFGVTYRYAVREDAANMHLRGGAVAAFGLVKALGAADVIQATADAGDVFGAAVVGNSALYALQCMLLFGFAAAAVEAGFSNGLVKRMGGTSGQ
ncbi:hypothetical protein COO60DRAFT_199711 [Scenedesmus sp. NREL 46B-D3]|nr:hypothetical protein COO60DRAFT_199711 [Scenedesmus sp. NREL 46B-D3]